MLTYLGKRMLQAIPILFGISLIVFALVNLTPGNPYASMFDPDMPIEQVDAMLRHVGYYDPLPVKYFKWLGRIAKGDLGFSIFYKEPVADIIKGRIGNTILLALSATLLSVLVGIPIGIITALKRGSAGDYLATAIVFMGLSLPTFFLGLLLIKLFGVDLKILPISGMASVQASISGGFTYVLDVMKHMVLPAGVLGFMNAATLMRYTRSSILDIVQQDYVRTARAKGVAERVVILKHAFKNALIPIITILSLQVRALLSGALLTETVFVWPGVGRLNFEAVQHRDYPLIMGIVMTLALVTLAANLVADILYAAVDPRIRYD